MKKVVLVTNMEEIPTNCMDCSQCGYGCLIPMKGKYLDSVKKAYLTKRPKNCPLLLLEANPVQVRGQDFGGFTPPS